MYEISNYSNKIKKLITGEIFPMDEFHELYSEYNSCRLSGGNITHIEFFEGEEAESRRGEIQKIDSYYTKLISNKIAKWIEKKEFGEITEIPPEIVNERNLLREECNQKIAELGVDIETYRRTNKETIILK